MASALLRLFDGNDAGRSLEPAAARLESQLASPVPSASEAMRFAPARA
jgi:hypothetical protein